VILFCACVAQFLSYGLLLACGTLLTHAKERFTFGYGLTAAAVAAGAGVRSVPVASAAAAAAVTFFCNIFSGCSIIFLTGTIVSGN